MKKKKLPVGIDLLTRALTFKPFFFFFFSSGLKPGKCSLINVFNHSVISSKSYQKWSIPPS